MSLLEIKHYMKQHRMSNLLGLMHYFNIDADLARNFLSHWQRKGKIKKMQKTNQCGTQCSKCDPTLTEIYEWVEDKIPEA